MTLPLPLPKKTDRVGTLGIVSIPFFTITNQEIFRSNRSNRSNALEMELRHALTDQPRISYGFDQSAPSKIRFLRFNPSSCNLCGAERISAHRNHHGFWRSELSVLICCHGLERISRECHGADRSRYPLVEKVTDYHRANIRPLEMSRIGADWAIRSVIIRITDYISIRTHPCYFLPGAV